MFGDYYRMCKITSHFSLSLIFPQVAWLSCHWTTQWIVFNEVVYLKQYPIQSLFFFNFLKESNAYCNWSHCQINLDRTSHSLCFWYHNTDTERKIRRASSPDRVVTESFSFSLLIPPFSMFYLYFSLSFFLSFFFFFLFLFRAAPTVHGGYQARGWIRAIAASLYHSHSNAGAEPHLQPKP